MCIKYVQLLGKMKERKEKERKKMERERLNHGPTGWGKSLHSVNTSPPEMDHVTVAVQNKAHHNMGMSRRKESE